MVFNLKPGILTIGVSETRVLSFDSEGRLFHAFYEGITYRRALDNRIIKKWRYTQRGKEIKKREWLGIEESRELIEKARADALLAFQEFKRGNVKVLYNWPKRDESHILEIFEKIKSKDFKHLEKERKEFYRIYTPIGILPPDQYLAIVIQVTHGCSWNRCIFCDFYRGIPFRIKSAESLKEHINRVFEFLGDSIYARKSIFLADANALVAPFEVLESAFCFLQEKIKEKGLDFRGYFAFLDIFTGVKREEEFWQKLSEYGLKRVYIGLETGDRTLYRWLNKPGDPSEILKLSEVIKSSGIALGLIIMAGIGGKNFRDSHFNETIKLLSRLSLGKEDIVYLSPFKFPKNPEYKRAVLSAGIEHLEDFEIYDEIERFKRVLKGKDYRVSIYDIDEFIY